MLHLSVLAAEPGAGEARGVKYPMYDEQNRKESVIYGEYGKQLPDGHIVVKGLRMELFREGVETLRLYSRQCFYDPVASQVDSALFVQVKRDNVMMTGKGFRWWARENRVKIFDRVEVRIDGTGDIASFAIDGVPGAESLVEGSNTTVITSKTLTLDYATRLGVFDGGVRVVQTNATISARKVSVVFDVDHQIESMTAWGDVTVTQGDIVAAGDGLFYSVPAARMVMTGDALVTRGPEALAGERITIMRDTGTMVCENGKLTLAGGHRPVEFDPPHGR